MGVIYNCTDVIKNVCTNNICFVQPITVFFTTNNRYFGEMTKTFHLLSDSFQQNTVIITNKIGVNCFESTNIDLNQRIN